MRSIFLITSGYLVLGVAGFLTAAFLAELLDIIETSLDLGDVLIEAALNGGLPFLERDSFKSLSSFSIFCLTSGSNS